MNKYQPTNTDQPLQRHYDDEIDLGQLIRNLWDSKVTIIAVTAACLCAALAYILVVPPTYQGSLKLLPITKAEEAKYSAINRGDFLPITTINFNSNGDPIERKEYIRISGDTLLQEFATAFSTKQALATALTDVSILSPKENETPEEFQLRGQSTLNNINIDPPQKDSKTGIISDWTVSFATKTPKQFKAAIEKAVAATNQLTAQNIEREIASRLVAFNLAQASKLEDLQTRLENTIEDYRINNERSIALLAESAQIARTLGIQKNTLESQNFSLSNGSSFIANVNSKDRDYLRGYEALEKEIELIQGRTDDLAYIPGYVDINSQIRAIEQNKTDERLQAALDISPLRQDSFSAIAFSGDQIIFSNQSKPSLILALSIVLGGMLGIFVALIRNTLK
ncbi:MAG: hypothetical protein HWE20_14740 [Gammaproteobacteria bacterium]|nr:hypothetical protein [Gammaproteobacteria bacterium]